MWPFKTKTISPVTGRKYSSVYFGLGTPKWAGRSYQLLAQEGFENNPVVYACVTRLAKAVASVDLELFRKSRTGKLVEVNSHAILDLMNRPNPAWTGRKFLEKLATQYLIGGNVFLWGNGADGTINRATPPKELWLLPPPFMKIEGKYRHLLPEYYEYRPGGGSPVRYPINQVTGLSSVLHVKTVNPLDEWYGLPPLVAASYGVDIFNEGQRWNKALLQNEGRPSGALQMRQGKDGNVPILTDEQYERLRSEVETSYTGSHNAGRPLLLDSALEWVQMSMSSKDMDHRETMLVTARLIAACYGTPTQLLNIPGDSTYANYEMATLAYWSDTVLPLLSSLLEEINRWLPTLFGEPDLFLWYDEEQIPAMEPRRKEKSQRLNDAEYMTINEKREAMGMEVHKEDNADEVLVNANDIPLSKLGIVDPKIHPELANTPTAAQPAKKPDPKA